MYFITTLLLELTIFALQVEVSSLLDVDVR